MENERVVLSLNQFAKELGVNKSSVSHALKSGKISYLSKDASGYRIDPSELDRAKGIFRKSPAMARKSNEHSQTSNEQGEMAGSQPLKSAIELARAESERDKFRELSEFYQKESSKWEDQANRWHEQFTQLQITHQQKPKSGNWMMVAGLVVGLLLLVGAVLLYAPLIMK